MIRMSSERVQRTKARDEMREPAMHTTRQPNLFTRALAMGPAKGKYVSASYMCTYIESKAYLSHVCTGTREPGGGANGEIPQLFLSRCRICLLQRLTRVSILVILNNVFR